jgi:hypothetical protein
VGWNNAVFPLLIITPSGGFTGLFLYSPGPGAGNLIGSWTSAAGVDPFGNAYPAGINVTAGVLSGVAIQALTETLQPGPLLMYGSSGQVVTAFTVVGSNNWVAPVGLVGSLIDQVIVTGAGGGGDGADPGSAEGGGGGGACSVMANVAVTIGNTYHPFVGTGGAVNTDGTASTFAGDAVTVTGNPGKGAVDPNFGAGGAASTLPAGVVSFAGGPGAGGGGAPHGGGGGGGAASNTRAGNAGQVGTGAAGGAGGALAPGFLAPGGAGGAGGAPAGNGVAGSAPGGGGGGGGSSSGTGAAGANGQVILVYRTTAGTPLTNSMAVANGTDPNTGASYFKGITSIDTVFGDQTNIYGANVTTVGTTLWQLNNADFRIFTVGRGLRVAEGANAKQGVSTLVGGTILVANTSVTAASRIHLTAQDNNSTGALRVSARVVGTSFTITSSNAADTGVVGWEIFEPG